MKNRIKQCGALFLLLCLCLCLAACGSDDDAGQLTLVDLGTVNQSNAEIGVELTAPADWHVTAKDEESLILSNEDGSISYSVTLELGGMSYFSKEELAGLATEVGNSTLTEATVQTESTETRFENAAQVVLTGKAPALANESDTANAVCEVYVIQQLADVRFYLVALTDVETYEEFKQVFDDIAASFKVTLTEDDFYKKLDNQVA